MRRIILTAILLSITLLPLFATTNKVMAVDVLNSLCNSNANNDYNPTSSNGSPTTCVDGGKADTVNPIYTILKIVIDILSFVVGIAAVLTIIVQGIRMVTSGGDPHSFEGARNGILYAVFGIVFAVLAQVFVALVLDKIS